MADDDIEELELDDDCDEQADIDHMDPPRLICNHKTQGVNWKNAWKRND